MQKEPLTFYPRHPSNMKTLLIETTPMPALPQEAPFDVESLFGAFAPAVAHGTAIHREMELLVRAGLTPMEVLTAATGQNADAFGLKARRITIGEPATMVLVEGRPDRGITPSSFWSKESIVSRYLKTALFCFSKTSETFAAFFVVFLSPV